MSLVDNSVIYYELTLNKRGS